MKHPEFFVLVIVPRRSAAIELASQLRIGSPLVGAVVDIAKDNPLTFPKKQRRIVITTADLLLSALRQRNPKKPLTGINLVICENLEQLDSKYELALSLLRHATQMTPTRFVGISSSLNDSGDLASWLNVDPFALHSFRPKDRGQSLTMHVQTFNIPQSASLFKAMAKPTHNAITSADSALVFVPSRGQCKTVAMDLLTQCALETETEAGYLPPGIPEEYLEEYRIRFRDRGLCDFISRGIGFYHEGIQREDRNLILSLYAEGIIRVLLVPHDSCWTIPVRASVVVVMGTQYLHAEGSGYDRQLRDYDLAQLVRMQGRAVRHSGSGVFHLFCQVEAKDTLLRFLNEGLPLESRLLETDDIADWYRYQREKGHTPTKQDLVDVLSFTLLGQRASTNPSYYDCKSQSRDENLSRIVDLILDPLTLDTAGTVQETS